MHSGFLILFISFFMSFNHLYAKSQAGWGVKLGTSEKKIKIGGRIQGVISRAFDDESSDDIYFRRLRVNMEFSPWENHKIYYDIRNDKVDNEEKGAGDFTIGDAYYQVKLKKLGNANLKFFRAKVDVSHSQTSSSKNLFNPNRAEVSDYAANFVNENRRSSNIQMNGTLLGRFRYHLAVFDGANLNDLEDMSGANFDEVTKRNLGYGGKFRYYFLGDPGVKIQDTYYGRERLISLGLGFFRNDSLKVKNAAPNPISIFNLKRDLTNVEVSIAFDGLRILYENFYFRGSVKDITASDANNITTDSRGDFLQVEYTFKKIAPFVSLERFQRDISQDNTEGKGASIGLNYYLNMEAQRFGLSYKLNDYAEYLNKDNDSTLYAYAMLNF